MTNLTPIEKKYLRNAVVKEIKRLRKNHNLQHRARAEVLTNALNKVLLTGS